MTDLYGIPNCDTVRKARKWLLDRDIAYRFHDYKKEGVDEAMLASCCAALGWEAMLNRRGTTWRRLPDSEKQDLNPEKAMVLMRTHPSLIKRPVLVAGQTLEVGFSEQRYQELFS
ncbi:MAG TPA: ArsC family reductase [Mariprofundaceae bacterium]|nr:ArsC family reductase [Mariprofundaceae bacterium]